jgi:hypothetical protein
MIEIGSGYSTMIARAALREAFKSAFPDARNVGGRELLDAKAVSGTA